MIEPGRIIEFPNEVSEVVATDDGGRGEQLLRVGRVAAAASQRPVDPLRQPFGRFGLVVWEHLA